MTPAVTITVAKSVDLAIAHPGDRLTYTVNIADTGTTDATGVQLLDAIDPNSTFVTNSVILSPMAARQSFNAVGNTQLSGTLTVGIHDLDAITPDANLVYSGTGPTSAGGAVTIRIRTHSRLVAFVAGNTISKVANQRSPRLFCQLATYAAYCRRI